MTLGAKSDIYATKDDIEYRIKISKRAKNVAIIVDNNCNVFIRKPLRSSIFMEAAIEKMIKNNHDKILAFIKKKKAKQSSAPKLLFNETIEIKGWIINFIPSTDNCARIEEEENKIKIFCPNIERSLLMQKIKKPIQDILLKISEQYVIPRLIEISKQSNLSFNKCKIKHVKTIWGSCSRNNNITLSSKLVVLEDKYIDYVINHELLHTKHKHHRPIFFEALSKLLSSDAKQLDRQINKQNHPILELLRS